MREKIFEVKIKLMQLNKSASQAQAGSNASPLNGSQVWLNLKNHDLKLMAMVCI